MHKCSYLLACFSRLFCSLALAGHASLCWGAHLGFLPTSGAAVHREHRRLEPLPSLSSCKNNCNGTHHHSPHILSQMLSRSREQATRSSCRSSSSRTLTVTPPTTPASPPSCGPWRRSSRSRLLVSHANVEITSYLLAYLSLVLDLIPFTFMFALIPCHVCVVFYAHRRPAQGHVNTVSAIVAHEPPLLDLCAQNASFNSVFDLCPVRKREWREENAEGEGGRERVNERKEARARGGGKRGTSGRIENKEGTESFEVIAERGERKLPFRKRFPACTSCIRATCVMSHFASP